MHKNPKISDFK